MVQVPWCPMRGASALNPAFLASDSDLAVLQGSVFAGTLYPFSCIYLGHTTLKRGLLIATSETHYKLDSCYHNYSYQL